MDLNAEKTKGRQKKGKYYGCLCWDQGGIDWNIRKQMAGLTQYLWAQQYG